MHPLAQAIKVYQTNYIEELNFKHKFLTLLEHKHCFFRDHMPGHITGSAWIIDPTRNFTLLTHHAKLNKWLQTGGHADGDENVLRVALREAEEETGVTSFKILQESIFDIDIHRIPARKDFPEHDHYDIRFLVEASMEEKIVLSDESHDVAWKSLDDIEALTQNNPSMMRMVEKTRKLV